MADDQHEPNRFLGFPWQPGSPARQGGESQPSRGKESQRVMGFPVDWFGGTDRNGFLPLTHPIREYKRWLRRRRLGPYAVDEDEP
jgi:hypothetical protein